MSTLDVFDPADRAPVAALPMLVSMAITAADPSGLFGAVKESAAMAGALARGKTESNTLIASAAENFASTEGRSAVLSFLKEKVKGGDPKAVVDSLVAEVGRLSGIVAAKAPAEAAGYTGWLMQVAQNVAEASTEGGFLGFGGVKVSPEEAATLERLRTALATPAAAEVPPPVPPAAPAV